MLTTTVQNELIDTCLQCWIPFTVAAISAAVRISCIAYTALGVATGMLAGLLVNKLGERYHIEPFKTLIDSAFQFGIPFSRHRILTLVTILLISTVSAHFSSVMGVLFGFYGVLALEHRLTYPTAMAPKPSDNPLW